MNQAAVQKALRADGFFYEKFYQSLAAEPSISLSEKAGFLKSEMANFERRLLTLEAMYGLKYNPDQPRAPAGNPDGGQWVGTQIAENVKPDANTRPDSGFVMDDSGNIYPVESPNNIIHQKPAGVFDEWKGRPSRNNKGVRYTDPNNKHNEVRVMPGDPEDDFSVRQNPYVKWMKNGQLLDKFGQATIDKGENHIPLEEFEFIPEVFLP